jgi:predicted negative regulator of RcsB-dependent stress response
VYFAFARKVKQKLAMYKAICFQGDVFLANGDEATAENLFTVALEAFTYMDVHRSRGDCMLRLGDIAWRRGNKAGAAVLWGEAGPLFARSQRIADVRQIEKRLAGCEQDQIIGFTRLDAPLRLA